MILNSSLRVQYECDNNNNHKKKRGLFTFGFFSQTTDNPMSAIHILRLHHIRLLRISISAEEKTLIQFRGLQIVTYQRFEI